MQNCNSKFKILILFSIFYFLFSIIGAQAADPLVPCGPTIDSQGNIIKDSQGNIINACKFSDFYKLIETVFHFAIFYIAIPLVVLMVVYGGFTIMTAGDSTERVAQGRKIIQAAIIGVIIVLGAWIIIDILITQLLGAKCSFQDYIKIFMGGKSTSCQI